jgi:hypothetical protein
LGGVAATTFVVDDATQIRANVPAAAVRRLAFRSAGGWSCVAPLDQLRSVYVPNSPSDTP